MKVFISYARQDVITARRLYQDLKNAGVTPWMDEKNLLLGQNWKFMITKAIRETNYFLALLSSHSLSKRGYVQKELKMALDILEEFPPEDVFILPVRLDECNPEDEKLKYLHRADLFPSYEQGLNLILQQLVPGYQINQDMTNSLGMKFVLIQPGEFMMGSPPDEPGRYDDEKLHKVILTQHFYMQTTQVTQAQWKSVMGNNPSRFKDCGDNCPVERVSWDDAQEFIKKLNQREGNDLYRFSGEAEWEYACRAGTTTPFAYGRCLSTDQANYDGDNPLEGCPKGEYREKTVPVGSFEPNAWGLYDMHGNVWEWCEDWFGYYPSGTVTDPKGPLKGSARVVRGGGWIGGARFCRSAYRRGDAPDGRNGLLGFRLLRSYP